MDSWTHNNLMTKSRVPDFINTVHLQLKYIKNIHNKQKYIKYMNFIVVNKTDIDGMLFAEPAYTRVWERSPSETAVKSRLVAFSYSSAQRKSADHRRNYSSMHKHALHSWLPDKFSENCCYFFRFSQTSYCLTIIFLVKFVINFQFYS